MLSGPGPDLGLTDLSEDMTSFITNGELMPLNSLTSGMKLVCCRESLITRDLDLEIQEEDKRMNCLI